MDAAAPNDADEKSKSRSKRDALALTELGAKLAHLSDAQRARLPLSDAVAQAVAEARRIASFGARKRQIKFIGQLLRREEAAPLIDALESLEQEGRREAERERRAARRRDQLLENGAPALESLFRDFPRLDRQHVRQLIRNAQREKRQEKPPASARALLRYLRRETA